MIDPHTKAMLLRVAIVIDVIFCVYCFKTAESIAFVKDFLAVLSHLRQYIHIGVVIRSDSQGVRGNFPFPVLLALTAFLIYFFVWHPQVFGLVFGSPLWLMRSSTFSWHMWPSLWLAPVNIILTCVIFWIALLFGIWFWMFSSAIVVKTVCWSAEVISPQLSKKTFDFLAFLLLAISGVLTFILI